jgi:hypothetical protein
MAPMACDRSFYPTFLYADFTVIKQKNKYLFSWCHQIKRLVLDASE